ncbi:SiaB family protein kinase [Magnetospira thiophila]
MLAQDMINLRNTLDANDVLFCYSGLVTEDVLTGIGLGLKLKLEREDTSKKVARALFSIFVEQVQNIIRYSIERDEPPPESDKEIGYGVLAVGNREDRYFVSCANMIALQDVQRLSRALKNIQSMSHDEIKAAYKKTLKGEVPEGSKGAGVGFLDIAMRATHGFEFDFLDVNDQHAYFCLKAYA